jgi:neuromedin U receptor 1
VLGVMGNLATCLVILNNEYMRTPTNVYLLNLAIADIATLVISEYQTVLMRQTS